MRSLTAKLILLIVVFLLVPAILYAQFDSAERAKRALLLSVVRDEGLLIARAMDEVLARADSVPYVQLGEELARYADDGVSLKLLFRPEAPEDDATGFFYVSSAPPVSTEDLAAERVRLVEAGILERLAETCGGEFPTTTRVELPGGRTELLTSITPVRTGRGCWVLIVSKPLESLAGVGFGRPYWQSPEIRIAAAVYLLLAVIVLGLFAGLWGSLRRFGRTARAIGSGGEEAGRFAERTAIPELAGVAHDFDRMVSVLRGSADNLRRAAEETAHAFKTPIAVIRQALVPMQGGGEIDAAGLRQRAEIIAAATRKLDGLVQAMRRIDWATADLLDAPRRRVELGEVSRQTLEDYQDGPRGVSVVADIAEGVGVIGSEAALETVVANLVENAVSFTPPGGTVRVVVYRGDDVGILMVEDAGPGIPEYRLGRIFDRYYTSRAAPAGGGAAEHFGIGLWIVRRNVEALGGSVEATNLPEGGLRMKVVLPLAGR